MKSPPSTPRRKARAPAKLGDIPAAATSTVSIGTLTWTIPESAETSLARVMNLPPGEAASAAREFVGELGPTKSRAQQPRWEIWRASSRWSRLRAVVERVSTTELTLREVLAHTDWQPPGARPAAVVAAQVPPPKNSEPSVLLVRRAAARPASADTAVPPGLPAGVSMASALSTGQLLALHEMLADWRSGGIWPGLTKLAAATELPRSQMVELAAELERLNLSQAAVGAPRREAPLLAEVRSRVQRAVQQALRPLPATTWRELRLDLDVLAERIFVVTVTAGFDTVDAVVEALGAAKAEGIVRVARGVRAVVRA